MATQNSTSSLPTIELNAQPSAVVSGDSTALSWSASNANSVSISGLGLFPAKGSVKVVPTVTTTYTATASGPGGKTESSALVSVMTSGESPRSHLARSPTASTAERRRFLAGQPPMRLQ
jgi:phospholipase C